MEPTITAPEFFHESYFGIKQSDLYSFWNIYFIYITLHFE